MTFRAKDVAFMRKNLQDHNPTAIKPYIWLVGLGDSILAGVAATSPASDDLAVGKGVGYSFYVNNEVSLIGRIQKGQNGLAGYSSLPALAQRLFDETGWRVAATFMPKAATSGVYESWGDKQPRYHWDVDHSDGNMLTRIDGTLDRSTILPMSKAAIDRCPGIDVQRTFVLWAGGSFDAGGITEGLIVQQDITDKLIALKDWAKVNIGADGMFFYESCVIGDGQTEAEATQANDNDIDGLRAAQLSAEAADPEIWCVYRQPDNDTDLYAAFAVNGDGTVDVGYQLHDGVHWSQAMQDAVGRTAAQIYIAPIVGSV